MFTRNPLTTNDTPLQERCLLVHPVLIDSLDNRLQDLRLDFSKKQRSVTEGYKIIERLELGRSVGRHYCLVDDRLFKQKTVHARSHGRLRLCVQEYRELFLSSCHDDSVAGRLGIQQKLTK